MNIAVELAEKLLKINAIKLSPKEPFTWASGIKSPIYCDNRITLSFPEVRNYIKTAFVEKCKDFEGIDIIVGVATAGIPHGALLADALNLPFAYVRSKPKEHGRKNQIEGLITKRQKALVIEDLISTGGSAIKAVEVLREIEVEVLAVGAIFEYGFEIAKNNFNTNNCDYFSLSNYVTALDIAEKSNYISPAEKSILNNWNMDPQMWYSKNFN